MQFKTLQKIRNLDYVGLKKIIKLYLIISVIIIIFFLFIFGYIGIGILPNNDYKTSILWLILNVFIYGVYFSFCGLMVRGIRREYKYYLLALYVFLFFIGFGLADIEFHINIPFLTYHTFSTSNIHGINFFMSPMNLVMFLGIFAITIPIESEK